MSILLKREMVRIPLLDHKLLFTTRESCLMERSLTVVLQEANHLNLNLGLVRLLNVGMKVLQNLAKEQKQHLLVHLRWHMVRGVQEA